MRRGSRSGKGVEKRYEKEKIEEEPEKERRDTRERCSPLIPLPHHSYPHTPSLSPFDPKSHSLHHTPSISPLNTNPLITSDRLHPSDPSPPLKRITPQSSLLTISSTRSHRARFPGNFFNYAYFVTSKSCPQEVLSWRGDVGVREAGRR
ncbi:hypothetical protein Pcinc_034250 [Petrolisthes cinctipes]|uniref:Uncharacterized protein n=1 Tax=Petrolisthes cinctipes TaxID=88211 RepID=A0AAE1EQP8_PETCI|nr:hypothetical protein Pcinc_034250 [Petrolisthes cinctipes]